MKKNLRNELIEGLRKDNTIELLEEVGKINIDFIDSDLELLEEVLETEFNVNTEIQSLVGGHYLVNLDYEEEYIEPNFEGWDS